jgi:iron complex outermembrane receptor protein
MRSYSIAAGPLVEALTNFAASAGITVSIDPALVDGKRSRGLSGSYAPADAIARLLEATGLQAVGNGSGTYVLRALPPVLSPAPSAVASAPEPSASQPTTTLTPVVITGSAARETATSRVDGYKADRSATATRIDVPLQDQPVSVTVIPADVIADQGVRNTTEVGDYVAGVARESTEYSPNGQSFFIRGFSTYGAASTLNGFRQDGFLGVTDPSAIERIEFLKGPAAVLYGASSAISGIANTVTKRPTPDAFTSIDLSGGQFGYARATIDANHDLGSDALLGRINIAAQRDDGFRSFPGSPVNTLLAITPIVSAKFSADTRAELELSAIQTRYGGRCDGVTADPILLALPITKEVICDDLAHASLDTYSARLEVEHRLDERWTLRVAGFFNRNNSERTEQYALNDPPVSADGHTLERYTQFVTSYSTNSTGQIELRGNVDIGGITHRLIGGIDLTGAYSPYSFFSAPATPMDIIDTHYDGRQLGPYVPEGPPAYNRSKSSALYLQDFIELGAHWKLLLGLRHDRVNSETGDPDAGTVAEQQTESADSPRVGVVYQPAPGTSIYTSWAHSFSPNSGARARNGSIFPAERGVQYEIGIKQELLDQRLNVTATVFDLTRSNVLTNDPTDPTGQYSIATGKQRSRGVELDFVGKLTPAWSVIGAYTYLDAQVIDDNTIPVGSKLVGAARNSGSVWSKVSLGALSLDRWSVGLGVVASSDREAQLPNIPITLGSYVRFDAGVYYTAGPWRAQVNVKNLTDKRIFVGQGYDLVPETPRAVMASVGYTF